MPACIEFKLIVACISEGRFSKKDDPPWKLYLNYLPTPLQSLT